MKRTSSVFVITVCLLSAAFRTFAQAPSPIPTPEINEADLIHFGDLIDVDYAGGSEYDWRGMLASDGALEGLNEFSPIAAVCRSEADVAADIARAYSKILRDPKFIVKIVDRSNRAVARIDGAVKVPMRFRILRPAHLRELVIAAGGFTDDASGEITILRPSDLNCAHPAENAAGQKGNGLTTLNISISELLSGKESADPVILTGDTITVNKAVPIYVIGAVNNPKPIYLHSEMTLTRALATAGGLAKGAAESKVTVFRRVGKETSVTQVDIEKIKNGEIKDVDLKAFDIIDVAFKGRAPRKYPPVIAAGDNANANAAEPPLRIIN